MKSRKALKYPKKVLKKSKKHPDNGENEENNQENSQKNGKSRKFNAFGKEIKWSPDMYYIIYDLASKGLPNTKICEELGINQSTMANWLRQPKIQGFTPPDGPTLKRCLAEARKPKPKDDSVATFLEFVFDRLPDHLKGLWEEINACDQAPQGQKRKTQILRMQSKRILQHLFLYAFCQTNFNISNACQVISITRETYIQWTKEINFKRLMLEINEAKKDFFESQLVKAAKKGDTKAIIFANKSLNKDRGYTEKTIVEHTGTITHSHTMINLDELYLPVNIRMAVLQAVKRLEERKRLEADGMEQPKLEYQPEQVDLDVIDGEFEKAPLEQEDINPQDEGEEEDFDEDN